MKFQMRGLAQNLHRAARIGHAGQLHLDAVVGLLPDIWFGNAKLVNPVAYCP
jgi:hypothetical protein